MGRTQLLVVVLVAGAVGAAPRHPRPAALKEVEPERVAGTWAPNPNPILRTREPDGTTTDWWLVFLTRQIEVVKTAGLTAGQPLVVVGYAGTGGAYRYVTGVELEGP